MKPVSALCLCLLMGMSVMAVRRGQAADAAKPPVYTPGLGEIMSLQQMRHSKLWTAGSIGNWALASYELEELKEGFEDAGTFDPKHDGQPIADLIAEITPQPLAGLETAIKARSTTKFDDAFDKLTDACNNCHQSADKPFIVIRRPATSPYTNQDFAPHG